MRFRYGRKNVDFVRLSYITTTANTRYITQYYMVLFSSSAVPNIDEEASKLVDKDGWIIRHDFLKYAMTTELLKVEFTDRVFQKVESDDKKSTGKKDSKRVSGAVMQKLRQKKNRMNQFCVAVQ